MGLVNLALLFFLGLGLEQKIEGSILNVLMNLETGLSTVSPPIEHIALLVSCLEIPLRREQVTSFLS